MGFTLVPEYRFDKFNDASADFLISIGVRGIILDVDNTLEPYEHPHPSEQVISWLDELKKKGIAAAIVSNNDADRINLFNEALKLPVFTKAGKPKKKFIILAMKALGTEKENTIFMGDQVFTDVWGAHNAGIRAILVPPINDKRDFLTRFKRFLERPVLRKYKRLKNKKDNMK